VHCESDQTPRGDLSPSGSPIAKIVFLSSPSILLMLVLSIMGTMHVRPSTLNSAVCAPHFISMLSYFFLSFSNCCSCAVTLVLIKLTGC